MRLAQLLSFSLLLISTALFAQPGSVSQAEVNAAKAFIEAKQAVLLGDLEKAESLFQKMSKEDPDNDVLHYELGRIHYVSEDNQEAVNELEKAYELNPTVAYAGLLGELYQATGQYREGAKLFKDLADSQTRSTDQRGERGSTITQSDRELFRLQQAVFLVRAQQIDKAIDVYDDLEKELGINPELSRKKHALYLGQGDQKRAEKELLALVDAFPRDLEYRHLLAGYYSSQGKRNDAKAVYREILRIEPADVKAQLALEDSGKPSQLPNGENNGKLMDLMSRTDVDLDLKIGKLLPMVQAVANTGDANMANEGLALADELARVHPSDAKPMAMRGDLYFHSGQYPEAAAAYRQTLELDDTVYPVWEQYLHSLYLDNQMKELREEAESALDVFPNRPYVTFYYALGEAARADFDEAAGLMEQAVFIFGAASPEAGNMARTYQETITALGEGELPQSGRVPAGEGPLSAYLLARETYESGKHAEALQLLSAADHARNTNALHLELLGDAILKTSGDKITAAAAYERAEKAGSKSRSLRRKISETKS